MFPVIRIKRIVLCICICIVLASPVALDAQQASIVNTEHNMSVTGPGTVKSLTETRVCIFCHTPHNAAPNTPLWNKSVEPKTYVPYWSPTMSTYIAAPSPYVPTGPTRLCLSCHDGTVAIGDVLQPSGGLGGGFITAPQSVIGGASNLSHDHPVSFNYDDFSANTELNDIGIVTTVAPQIIFYTPGHTMHCSSCHDAHEDAYQSPDLLGRLTGKFLVMNNRSSNLCIQCHNIPGWSTSSHSTSTAPVAGILPVPPKIWPTWSMVADWGCENCHTVHGAQSDQYLLYYPTEDEVCAPCHTSGAPGPAHSPIASAPIRAGAGTLKMIATNKMSGHNMAKTKISYDPKKPLSALSKSVTCVDCHNPHIVNRRPAPASRTGKVAGAVEKVRGVTKDGVEVAYAAKEYEICFKCHSDYASQIPFIPRVINSTNTRLQFETTNPSFHPIEGIGRNANVPSLKPPSPDTEAPPKLTASSIIYCTDCHSDDRPGARGPHASSFAPILKRRYETMDNTSESYQTYSLCYRCHNRTSILSDMSFRKKIQKTTPTGGGHSGHLAKGATCSICHDAHGIKDNGISGSHAHLINFDTRVVSPVPGKTYPVYQSTGMFSGNCTLICHGVAHNKFSYPF